MKMLSKTLAITSLVTAGLMSAPIASAEVSASAELASSYLYRGVNLSKGEAVMSASLDWSGASGAYAGVWSSSGDTAAGHETDLYGGYAGDMGSMSYDVMYGSYFYAGNDDINDYAELLFTLSMDAASLQVVKNTDSDKNGAYLYVALGYEMDKYGVTLGNVSGTDITFPTDYTHVDVAYAYSDKLTFTYSQVVSQDKEDTLDDGGLFVVTYSLPVEQNH